MDTFKSGYDFFVKNMIAYKASVSESEFVQNVDQEVNRLVSLLNVFQGIKTDTLKLKGDIAEIWHAGTFNINAALNNSSDRVCAARMHEFASPDIISNFDKSFGLKYYNTGVESAKAQSVSIFQRYCEYKAKGGTDILEEYLSKRGYDSVNLVLNDPIYNGQIRIIPEEQMQLAKSYLQKKIQEEIVNRPDQVYRYQETLEALQDRISNGKSVESIPLTIEKAERITDLSKEGNVTAEKLNLNVEELIKYKVFLRQAFKAGLTSATITMVLKVVPVIFSAIDCLIKNGEIDEKQFRELGFSALSGASEGFIFGSVSAAITTACKAGLWGKSLKGIDPSIIGIVTVVAMDTMKNAFKVATGKMTNRELANEFAKEMYVSTFSLIGGSIVQLAIPTFGFMIGSFIGSVIGSFAYNYSSKAILSFCVDSGFTMFGLVEQDYTLPESVLKEIGIEVFEYDQFEYTKFHHDEFQYSPFELEQFKYDTIDITFLRRGVIGVSKIGYV